MQTDAILRDDESFEFALNECIENLWPKNSSMIYKYALMNERDNELK